MVMASRSWNPLTSPAGNWAFETWRSTEICVVARPTSTVSVR